MDTDRKLLADQWLTVFLDGEKCRLCLFNQTTVEDLKQTKKVTRECVAADARHCPALHDK